MKKHFIIGTSGHVDHGKTALIKALTGKDLDTHKEEKSRGITINNGFTHLKLGEFEVGVIDVPGHKDFIRNMISGATGIDVAMLVIAANSGPEKQTLEHLQILNMLSVPSVIIVLTKCDLVSEEEMELTKELILDLCEETSLKDSPVIEVSAHKKTGLDKLQEEIIKQLQVIQNQQSDGPFRHFLDRSFIIQGHGTVVTGTVHSGSCSINDKLWLHPEQKELKVRGMQRHGKSVDQIFSGDRCSINISNIKKEDISQGMLISDRQLNQVKLVDAELELFGDVSPGDFWCDALFYTGSYESHVKISLLDSSSFEEEKRLIQIHLPEPYPVCYGDKFILRNTSDSHTIGGGTILDPAPLHHRRRRKTVLDRLNRISEKGLKDLLNIKIHEAAFMQSSTGLAELLNLGIEQVEKACDEGLSRISVLKGSKKTYLIPKPRLKDLKKDILKIVSDYHIVNYLKEDGISLDEIAPKFRSYRNSATEPDFIKQVMDNLCKENLLIKKGSTWCSKDREMFADSDLEKKVDSVKKWYDDLGMITHSQRNLVTDMQPFGIDEDTVHKIVIFLQKSGWLTRIEDSFLKTENIDTARKAMLLDLLEHSTLTVAEFRDLIAGNRTTCLMSFSLFEKEGIVQRQGDDRVLTEKGKNLALNLKKAEV